MLVGLTVSLHGRNMNASLVGECAAPDEGLMGLWVHVGDLGDGAGDLPQAGEPVTIDTARKALLQDQRRNDGTQVGVSAPLAPTVDGSLDVAATLLYEKKGVRYSTFGIVVHVSTNLGSGESFLHTLDDSLDLGRKSPTVGIAQDEAICPCLVRGFKGFESVISVILVPVEKVLGVIKYDLSVGLEVSYRIVDHVQVFLKGRS